MSTLHLGRNAVCKYNIGGQGGSGWVELAGIQDVALNSEVVEAAATTRDDDFEITAPVRHKVDATIKLLANLDDAGYQALRDAFTTMVMVGIQIRAVEDGPGFQGDFMVSTFNESHPLSEGIPIDLTIKPTPSTTPPSWLADER